MKPYTVLIGGGLFSRVQCETLLDALCLVGWANNSCRVWEYKTEINLKQHRDLIAYIETCKGRKNTWVK